MNIGIKNAVVGFPYVDDAVEILATELRRVAGDHLRGVLQGLVGCGGERFFDPCYFWRLDIVEDFSLSRGAAF